MFRFVYTLDYFVFVLFAFVVLGLVSSVPRQAIGWEELLRNDLVYVEWDVKPNFNQSITLSQRNHVENHKTQCKCGCNAE